MHVPRTTLIALLLAAGAPCALAQEETPLTRTPAIRQPEAPRAQAEAPKEHSPDAVAAIRGAADAVKEGFSATVRTYAQGNSLLETTFPKGEGRWAQGPVDEEHGVAPVRYTGSGTVMTREEPIDFDILYQHDRVTWVDHTDQSYHVERLNGRKSGEAYMLASSAWTQAEDLARAFAGALDAHSLQVQEPAEIEGVQCDVIAVKAKTETDSVLWYFGREDHLPRRCEIVIPSAEFGGSIRVDFTDVAAGAEAVSDVVWEIPAPEGYTQQVARSFQARDEERPQGLTPLPAPRSSAPDWEVADSEGKLVSPGSLRGKVSVLYFWGTWAPACKRSTPEVALFAEDYTDKPVEVISMAFREGSPEDVVEEARAQGQTWRQVPQADDAVSLMGIRVAPSFVVLGPEGELLFRSGRPQGDDYRSMFVDVRQIVDRALADMADGEKKDEPAPAGAGAEVSPGAKPTRVAPPTKRGG